MALPLPFEPVNITKLRREFPHVNWDRWSHAPSYAYGTTYYRHAANQSYSKMSNLGGHCYWLDCAFSKRCKSSMLRNIPVLLAQMERPPTLLRGYGDGRGCGTYDRVSYMFEPVIVWALVVRNPWFLARDLQRICVESYLGDFSNVTENLEWAESRYDDDDLHFDLDPFIYENPTISTAMARCGLRSPNADIRDLVAHAITKPPPCVGLVARFIDVLLMNAGLPLCAANIITNDYLYDPWAINDWNEDYMLMRVRSY